MNDQLLPNLVKLGFSEYEAKAYIALLGKNPVSGYELAKQSGVPRSMIYEVAGKLTARGAAMTCSKSMKTWSMVSKRNSLLWPNCPFLISTTSGTSKASRASSPVPRK
jgi:sugar-specific transcriptional regulator TrmB